MSFSSFASWLKMFLRSMPSKRQGHISMEVCSCYTVLPLFISLTSAGEVARKGSVTHSTRLLLILSLLYRSVNSNISGCKNARRGSRIDLELLLALRDESEQVASASHHSGGNMTQPSTALP